PRCPGSEWGPRGRGAVVSRRPLRSLPGAQLPSAAAAADNTATVHLAFSRGKVNSPVNAGARARLSLLWLRLLPVWRAIMLGHLSQRVGDGACAIGRTVGVMHLVPFVAHQRGPPEEAVKLRHILRPVGQAA